MKQFLTRRQRLLANVGPTLQYFLEEEVDHWHAGKSKCASLREHLGLTEAEYRVFVVHPDDLAGVLPSGDAVAPWAVQVHLASAADAAMHGVKAVKPGEGITLSALQVPEGPPIILMVDQAHANAGCSLTNCADHIVNYVAEQYLRPKGIPIQEAIWIELDSDGRLDWVLPHVPEGQSLCLSVDWAPLKSDSNQRSLAALLDLYGNYGQQLFGMSCHSRRALQEKPSA